MRSQLLCIQTYINDLSTIVMESEAATQPKLYQNEVFAITELASDISCCIGV